jgi:mannose-6-phosphate isomerase-like protein (cupin superfamily)
MRLLFAFVLAVCGAAWLPAADLTEVAYVPAPKVDAALAHKADLYLVKADNVGVEGNYRDKAGNVELHEALTDVFYVTSGECTFVAGGKLKGGERSGPGQIRGGTIEGGTTYHLAKGDVIVIPAGIPHWFKEVPAAISYYVVKVPAAPAAPKK